MKPSLADVQEVVAEHMDQILSCFKPGGKITVLVRFDGLPGRDFMMTNEANILDAVAALHRRNEEASHE